MRYRGSQIAVSETFLPFREKQRAYESQMCKTGCMPSRSLQVIVIYMSRHRDHGLLNNSVWSLCFSSELLTFLKEKINESIFLVQYPSIPGVELLNSVKNGMK